MKKNIISMLAAAAVVCSSGALHADEAPTQVGKASSDSANTSKNKGWHNAAIAVGVIAVAAVAVILIANNHHHHHHSH